MADFKTLAYVCMFVHTLAHFQTLRRMWGIYACSFSSFWYFPLFPINRKLCDVSKYSQRARLSDNYHCHWHLIKTMNVGANLAFSSWSSITNASVHHQYKHVKCFCVSFWSRVTNASVHPSIQTHDLLVIVASMHMPHPYVSPSRFHHWCLQCSNTQTSQCFHANSSNHASPMLRFAHQQEHVVFLSSKTSVHTTNPDVSPCRGPLPTMCGI